MITPVTSSPFKPPSTAVVDPSNKRKAEGSQLSGEPTKKGRVSSYTKLDANKLDALCGEYHHVALRIKELEREKEKLKKTILASLGEDKTETPHFKITRINTTRINTPLEDAIRLKCTSLQEVADKQKLRCLYETGIPVPGVSISKYFRLKEITDKEK